MSDLQQMKPVDSADHLIDVAFRKAKKTEKKGTIKENTPIKQGRELELQRLSAIKDTLISRLIKIQRDFPDLRTMTDFQKELFKLTCDIEMTRKGLGSLGWAKQKIIDFTKQFKTKILQARTSKVLFNYRKQYYGRISSVIKQIKKPLKYLEEVRKTMKEFPVIKMLPTIAIAGFPNVGKSTLLFKLTGSTPEIASYSFTTKSLKIGNITQKGKKYQLIDTPGTLNRTDKMNFIEKQAYLAIKMVAEKIIYIIDGTEPYSLKKQEKLLKTTKKIGKPTIVYLSKTDILRKETTKKLQKKFEATTTIKQIKEWL